VYLLSLDNPRDIFKMLPMLIIQMYRLTTSFNLEVRQVKIAGLAQNRIVRTGKDTKLWTE